MVPFFLSTLAFSILGILTLFVIKSWELKTGKMLGAPLRPKAHSFFSLVLLWIERVIPALARIYSRRAWHASLAFVHRSAAFLVLYTEHLLQKALYFIHHSTDVRERAAGEASAFLREVAEHKRKLLRARHSGSTIVPARLRKE